MEKLIDLLNKFEREVYPEEHEYIKFPDWTDDDWWYWYYEEDPTLWEQEWFNYTSRGDKRNSELNQLLIISKEYGFIQRLVEQDKIDVEKEIKNSELNWLHERYLREDCLLMLLSISEQPIEFLCSILK